MPAVSEAQRRAMWAAREGRSTLGIPKKVGEEFTKNEKPVGKDQTGADFLGMLRNLAAGFLAWTDQEGREAEHPGAPTYLTAPQTEAGIDCGPGPMTHDAPPVLSHSLPQRHESYYWGSPRQPPVPTQHSLGTNGHGSYDNGGGWASPRFPAPDAAPQAREGYDGTFPGSSTPPGGAVHALTSPPMQITFSPDALAGGVKFSTGPLIKTAQVTQPRNPSFSRAIDRSVDRGGQRSMDAGASKIGSEPIRTPPLKPPDAKPEPLEPSRSTTSAPMARRDSTSRDWASPRQPQYDARIGRRASLLRHRT